MPMLLLMFYIGRVSNCKVTALAALSRVITYRRRICLTLTPRSLVLGELWAVVITHYFLELHKGYKK